MIQKYVSFVFRLALLISLLISTGCAAVQPAIPHGYITPEEIQSGIKSIQSGYPGAFAMYSSTLNRWAYFWKADGSNVIIFANSTGELLTEGNKGYAFRVSDQMASQFKDTLRSMGNGYKIVPVVLAVGLKDPGLVTVLMIPGSTLDSMGQKAIQDIINEMFPVVLD